MATMYVHILRPIVPLEIGSRIWSATRVVVLLEVRLEGACAAVRFVAESGTCAGHQIRVVFGDALLLSPHAPAYDGNTTEKDGTTDATDNTANDGLVGGAEAAAAATAGSRCWQGRLDSGAGGVFNGS